MNAQAQAVIPAIQQASLVARFASKFGVEPNKMLDSLKATAFHSDKEITNEQMMGLLIVAEQYGLNPWTREIYAFPDKNKGGIVPIVSVDGWSRILNERPELAGIEFDYGPDAEPARFKGAPTFIDCTIHRSDRAKPTKVRERLVECWRDTGPWNSHPGRMLRHKALMQAARVAFGFAGIYDADEGERIVHGEVVSSTTAPAVESINAEIVGKPIDVEAKREGANDSQGSGTEVSGGEPEKVATATEGPSQSGAAAPPKGQAPTLPMATVKERLAAALSKKSRDDLDTAAAEIDLVVSGADRKMLVAFYKECVAALEADDGK